MKQKLLCIVLLSIIYVTNAYSQRYQDARNFQASIGYLNKGFTSSVAFEQHKGIHHSFLLELSFFTEKEKVVNSPKLNANFINFYLSPKYRYYFKPVLNKPLYPYIGMGAFGGYEIYTNKKDVPNHINMDRKDQFIWGLNSDIGVEYNLQQYSIFISYSPMYEFKMKDYIHHVRIGAKYIF